MPEQYVPYSKQAIGALQGQNLATNGSLDEKAAEKIIQDFVNKTNAIQSMEGFTIDNFVDVVKQELSKNLTPQGIAAMTDEGAQAAKGLPLGWFLVKGANPKSATLGDITISGNSKLKGATFNLDTGATPFTGGGGGGIMGSFWETFMLNLAPNSLPIPDLRADAQMKGITDELILALSPEMKAISSGEFNVGKNTVGTKSYTMPPGWEEKLKNRLDSDTEKVSKDIDVLLDPLFGLIIGLSEIMWKLIALLLIETKAHDAGKVSGVEWKLFEYVAANVFFKLNVKRLLELFQVKKDNKNQLFTVRARAKVTSPSGAEFKKGNFTLGNAVVEIGLNINKNVHTKLDTSIYEEERNLFTETTRVEFFKAMAKLQESNKLLAINYPSELRKNK